MSTDVNNLLSNYSYINKDFNTVWQELLNTASKISAKWDPNSSNESDPGVVILKLIALLADKCNYNIDANVMELFPSTVAQTANAREIFEQLGYSMKWYKSGKGTINIKYSESSDSDEDEDTSTTTSLPEVITLPQFSMICDADTSIIYTITTQVSLNTVDSSYSQDVEVIQGIISDYEILGEKLITAEQLDNNYRLYFTETNVAQNGVFITGALDEDYTEWTQVDNLNTQDILSKVYKFGVTRENVPYIEFPTDIANLIPDGIYIKYIVSDGLSGNISKNVLEKFYNNPTTEIILDDESTETYTFTADNTLISQTTAIINGSDPESIDEAYKNYSKTVGVFNTLVSLRDYTNAIYKIGSELEYVSNDIVTDRTTDIQSSYKVVTNEGGIEYTKIQTAIKDSATYDASSKGAMTALLKNPYDLDGTDDIGINPYGGQVELGLAEGEEGDGTAQDADQCTVPKDAGEIDRATLDLRTRNLSMDDYEITPFDLKLYMLNYCAEPAGSLKNYNSTFTMINYNESETDTEIEGRINTKIVNAILSEIDDYKSVQHEFVPLLNNRPTIFINNYPVKAIIVPQYKLTTIQIAEIKANVYTALFNNLNAMQLSFGEEVTYDEVYDILQNADERIKSVILEPIEFSTFVMFFSSVDDYTYTDIDSGVDYEIIKDAWNLIPFNINTTIKNYDGEDVSWGIDCFAKSVLAGVTDLYEKQSDFNYATNQVVKKAGVNVIIPEASKVTSSTEINLTPSTVYTVQENENIFIQCPSYKDGTTYSTSIKYEYYFKDTSYSGEQIDAIADGSDYCIKNSESYLILYWKENDSDTFYKYRCYSEGTIVQPVGFTMDINRINSIATEDEYAADVTTVPIAQKWATETTGKISSTDSSRYNILSNYYGKTPKSVTKIYSGGHVLSSTKNIIIRVPSALSVTPSDGNYFYWLLNNVTTTEDGDMYRLFEENETDVYDSYQLKTNEYFLICNKDLTGMYIFGSGTKIERTGTVAGDLDWVWEAPVTDVTDLNTIGVEVLQKVWQQLDDSYNGKLDITEMQFIALGADALIKTEYANGYNITSTPQALATHLNLGDIYYKSDSTATSWETVMQMDLSSEALEKGKGWSIFSNLNISLTTDAPQKITNGQMVSFTDTDGNVYRYQPGEDESIYLQSTETVATEGGENIDISIYNPYTDVTSYTSVYGYTINNSDEFAKYIKYENFNAKLLYTYSMKSNPKHTLTFGFPKGKYILPVYITTSPITNLIITATGDISMDLLNKYAPNSILSSQKIAIFAPTKGDIYYLALEITSNNSVTLSFQIDAENVESGTQIIILQDILNYTEREYLDENDNPKYVLGDFFEDVLARMKELDYNGIYNFVHKIEDDLYIKDPLAPESFMKENHIYNKFTLCRIKPTTETLTADIIVTNNIK